MPRQSTDFDFSQKDRKWTPEERQEVVRLRKLGWTPLKISKKTKVPLGTVKFWIKPPKKTRKNKNKRNSYYRADFNDWLSWKSAALVSSFKQRHDECHFDVSDMKSWVVKCPKSCHYCEIKLTEKTFGVDHALPLARGGTNDISNLRQCCQNCNTIKGALTEEEYASLRELCSTWEDGGTFLFARMKRGNKFF
jgi:5-methylcytosine-specific restriction endonuclease McrA